jgi:hypothetical protein
MLLSKKQKADAVTEVCELLGKSPDRLFDQAAAWVFQANGQRIKNGAVKAALAKWRRNRTIPKWVGQYLKHLRGSGVLKVAA